MLIDTEVFKQLLKANRVINGDTTSSKILQDALDLIEKIWVQINSESKENE